MSGSWQERPLGDLFRLHREGVTPAAFPREVFEHYSLPAFDATGGPSMDLGISIESNKTLLSQPTVLVSKLNPRKPRAVLVHGGGGRRRCASTEWMPYTPIGANVDLEFYKWLLGGPKFHRQLERFATGSTNSHVRVSPSETLCWDVPVPPLPEQRRIAELLDTLDDAIRKTGQVIAKLQQMKQGLLHDLLTRGIDEHGDLRDPDRYPEQFKDSPLGRIPKGWNVQTLASVTDMQVGFAFKSEWFRETGTVRLMRGDNVGVGTPDWKTPRFLSTRRMKEFTEYLLEAGDVVVGMDRTFTGSGVKVSVISDTDLPALLVQRVGRFRPTGCTRPFLRYLLSWPRFLRSLQGQQKGMDIPHLSKTDILAPLVPVPPIDEQFAIGTTLDASSSRLAGELRSIDKVRMLKAGLLDALLTGRVRTLEMTA